MASFRRDVTISNYALGVGQAMSTQTHQIVQPGCFPNPFDGSGGTSNATLFIGKGLSGGVLSSPCLPQVLNFNAEPVSRTCKRSGRNSHITQHELSIAMICE
jgi:hypothetical protein